MQKGFWQARTLKAEEIVKRYTPARPDRYIRGFRQGSGIVARLQVNEILLHLSALHLLSDRTPGVAPFYFESESARNVICCLPQLFQRDKLVYCADGSIEDFSEHSVRKGEKSS
jgi:hypothetical protein